MTLSLVKLGRAVIFLPKTLTWNKVSFRLTESCRAGGKRAHEEYLQENLQYSFFCPFYHCLL